MVQRKTLEISPFERGQCKICHERVAKKSLEVSREWVGMCIKCIRGKINERIIGSERLCKRREAIAFFERKFKAAYLYASCGDAVHPVSPQSKDVSQRKRSAVVIQPAKTEEETFTELTPFDFGEIKDEL